MFREASCKSGVWLIHFLLSSSAVTASFREAVEQHTHLLLKSNQLKCLLYQHNKYTPHVYPKLSAKTQRKQQAEDKAYFSLVNIPVFNLEHFPSFNWRRTTMQNWWSAYSGQWSMCFQLQQAILHTELTKKFLRSKPNNYNCILIVKAPCNSSACSFTIKLLKSPWAPNFYKILAVITYLHMENIFYFLHSVCQKILCGERKFQ